MMHSAAPDSERGRLLLRGYLLGTLSARQKSQVQRLLESSDAWRHALDAERDALGALDRLPEEEPRQDLTEATLTRIEQGEGLRTQRVRPLRVAAVAAAIAAFGLIVAGVLPILTRAREASQRESVANTLKEWGVVLKMYASENKGQFPPLTRYGDVWFVDMQTLYPDYLSNPDILVNVALPESAGLKKRIGKLMKEDPVNWEEITRIAAQSFTYTGYALTSNEDARKLSANRKKLAAADRETRPVNGVTPLKEGVERFFITDINNPAAGTDMQATIPVMFENVYTSKDNHRPIGCNVLYMDGHVAFIRYGEAFPVTDAVAEVFRSPKPAAEKQK
jgi:prepilin-type processing-associated H-X9-DG protein